MAPKSIQLKVSSSYGMGVCENERGRVAEDG
jgi:hypothetical protein